MFSRAAFPWMKAPLPSPSSLSFSKAALGHENDHNNHAMLSPSERRERATAAALEDKKGDSWDVGSHSHNRPIHIGKKLWL